MIPAREVILDIEHVLCAKMRPTFLAVQENNDDILILVSCIAFNRMSIQERISSVFSLLGYYCNDIFDSRLIVVSAFSSSEMDIVLNDVFTKELK